MCPEPLTPPDCDLQGMDYMPFEVQYWRDSNLALSTTDEEFRAGIMLAWASWHQVPAASVPNDDSILIAMSGMGRKAPLADWLRIKPAVLREWVLCADGRYYHPRIAQRALAAWAGRTRYRGGASDGPMKPNAQRVRRIRQEHKAIRSALKKFYGIQIAYNAPIDSVRENLIKARIEKPEIAAIERPFTDEAMAGIDATATPPETVTPVTPVTVTHFRGITGLPETVITGPQVEGKDEGKAIPEELLPEEFQAGGTVRYQNGHQMDQLSANASYGEQWTLTPPPTTPPSPGAKKRALTCPVDTLVHLYETHMPNNPRIRHITPERKRTITRGWVEASKIQAKPFHCYSTERDGLAAWEVFFQTCATSDFLTGKAPARAEGQPPFVATIDFLMKPGNIVKCLENKYHR